MAEGGGGDGDATVYTAFPLPDQRSEEQSALHLQFSSPLATTVYAYPRLAHRVMHASRVRLPYQSVESGQSTSAPPSTAIIGCGAAEMLHPAASLVKVVHPLAGAHLQLLSAAWIAYAYPAPAHTIRHASSARWPSQSVAVGEQSLSAAMVTQPLEGGEGGDDGGGDGDVGGGGEGDGGFLQWRV